MFPSFVKLSKWVSISFGSWMFDMASVASAGDTLVGSGVDWTSSTSDLDDDVGVDDEDK